jgi:hypothetical protein
MRRGKSNDLLGAGHEEGTGDKDKGLNSVLQQASERTIKLVFAAGVHNSDALTDGGGGFLRLPNSRVRARVIRVGEDAG